MNLLSKIPLFPIAILCLFCISCHSNKETTASNIHYFDLAKIIQDDITYDSSKHCGEEKTVLVNNVRETKMIDSIDWRKELQPILDCDINKPAWKGKFKVDTLQLMVPGEFTVQYNAISDKMNIRLLRVNFKNNQLKNINIVKKIHSLIFSATQQIEYIPATGFTITGEQKAALMKDFELNVEVKYNCK